MHKIDKTDLLLASIVQGFKEQLPSDLEYQRRLHLKSLHPKLEEACEKSRQNYHNLLDKAMDMTPEGESFLGYFVNLVVKS